MKVKEDIKYVVRDIIIGGEPVRLEDGQDFKSFLKQNRDGNNIGSGVGETSEKSES